jgi:hypothetical protein
MGAERHCALILVFLVVLLGCASAVGTADTLKQYVGKPLAAFIDRHGYPVEKPIELPGGTRSYHFVNANGAFLEGRSGAWSHPCHVWLEVDSSGTILKYRYEGCD